MTGDSPWGVKIVQTGWKCPNCGGGVSPHSIRCPCVPQQHGYPRPYPWSPVSPSTTTTDPQVNWTKWSSKPEGVE